MTEFHGHEADHQHHGHQHGDFSPAETIDMLDLEGEALRDYWDDALTWIRRAADGAPRKRLLDLGAGTGTGALGLARHFAGAEVVAMSLHHMADPSRVLRDVLAATSPGGLIFVAEFSEPLRFLPDDLGIGKPGFEDRLIEAVTPAQLEEMPTLGSAWAPRMTETGWIVLEEREFRIDQNPPRHPSANRFARAWFTRLSHAKAGSLGPEDRATLAILLADDGEHSVLHRKELHIRGVRTITVGQRGIR
jgi:ubiquinone/menaquinone biosynthesis C-methylase UbiE